MKKPAIAFTIADERNMPYAQMMVNSFKKFHKDIPIEIITGDTLQSYLKKDGMFFYRSTPIIAEKYIADYELVLKLDADQIITGSLDYIFNTKDYDVGTVINYNRKDAKEYGLVQGWGILPIEYFNCGLVAMRSEQFVKHWKNLCFSPQFDRMQYKEQDILNAICYYGNYNIRCFDHFDGPAKMQSWWGLLAKGEWYDAYMKDGKIMIPKGKGSTPFPPKEVQLNVIHFAGGNGAAKMNYKIYFKDEVSKYIDTLVKP